MLIKITALHSPKLKHICLRWSVLQGKTNFLSDNQLKMLQRALTANTHKKYVWVKVVDEA